MCNKTAGNKDRVERSQACECYSKAYTNKFSLPVHVAINNWSTNNPGKGVIIPLMMEKEIAKCKIKWSVKVD